MNDYKTQNNELLNSFLGRTFFRSWQTPVVQREKDVSLINYSKLELQLNPICSTHCQYCYLAKYGQELMPKETWAKKPILANLRLLLDWLKENNYYPDLEIFSGDPFIQELGYDVLDMILEWYDGKEPISLVVPTNMDFLHYPEKEARIRDYYSKFREKNIRFALSASVDGKLMEENRPHRSPLLKYDEEFYDKLFRFSADTGTGFHPMVYSNRIELWKDNFLWFQDMFNKYGIDCGNIYLLEVRNKEWTPKQCKDFEQFIDFLVHWTWDRAGQDKQKMIDFLFKGHGFNMLSSSFTTVGRGIGCSIQSSLQIRLGDLTFAPCHRTSYDFMTTGKFSVDGDKIIDIISVNPALFFTINALDISGLPMCNTCLINEFCSGGCLGSQYETTGDPFSPIPTVCRLMFHKIRGLVRAYEDIGLMPDLLGRINKSKVETYKICKKEQII